MKFSKVIVSGLVVSLIGVASAGATVIDPLTGPTLNVGEIVCIQGEPLCDGDPTNNGVFIPDQGNNNVNFPIPAGGIPFLTPQAAAPADGVLGNSREIQLTLLGLNTLLGQSGFLTKGISAGQGHLSNTSGVDGALTIWYDGNANGVLSGQGLNSYDLTESAGSDGSFIWDYNSDLGVDVIIFACAEATGNCVGDEFQKSASGGFQELTHPFNTFRSNARQIPLADIMIGDFGNNLLAYADDPTDAAGVLEGLGALGFYFRATNRTVGSLDFDITPLRTNHVNAVPEPGTILLLGSGLAALGLMGYRRRRQS
jgi:hypothetical protein